MRGTACDARFAISVSRPLAIQLCRDIDHLFTRSRRRNIARRRRHLIDFHAGICRIVADLICLEHETIQQGTRAALQVFLSRVRHLAHPKPHQLYAHPALYLVFFRPARGISPYNLGFPENASGRLAILGTGFPRWCGGRLAPARAARIANRLLGYGLVDFRQ